MATRNVTNLLFYIVLFLPFAGIYSQNPSTLLDLYQSSHHVEKVYFSHDKTYYFPEDIIYGKIFLINGVTHELIVDPILVHVEWISPEGEILEKLEVKAVEGSTSFTIKTTLQAQAGSYTLRAYTNYQKNFDPQYIFQKEILMVESPDDVVKKSSVVTDFDFQFFPEGGYLVSDLPCMLAFKANDLEGNSIEVSGHIVDDEGKVVTVVKTHLEGIGKVSFNSETGKNYTAVIAHGEIQKTFTLPKALVKGHSLKISTRGDNYAIDVTSNRSSGLENSLIIGHVRGQVFMSQKLSALDREYLLIDKGQIPSGIVHFTLFDEAHQPVAERLVFNNNLEDNIKVELGLDTELAGKRHKVSGNLSISNDTMLQSGIGSVTVYSTDVFENHIAGMDIKNYLLLQSDLEGKIRNLNEYFTEDSELNQVMIDMLLLTHGWRRFSWQSVLDSAYPQIDFLPESNSTIIGSVTLQTNDKPVKSEVSMTILNNESFSSHMLTTGEDGRFFFTGLDLTDTTEIILQASKHSKKKSRKKKEGELTIKGNRFVDITMIDTLDLTYFDSSIYVYNLIEITEIEQQVIEDEEGNIRSEYIIEENQSDIFDGAIWSLDIDEVVVTSRLNRAQKRNLKVKKKYKEKGVFFFSSTPKIMLDEPQYEDLYFGSVYDVISQIVPSTTVVTEGGRKKIYVGRYSKRIEATLFVNGNKVDLNRTAHIDSRNIAVIDVISGMRAAAVYGVGLVIHLLTKNDEELVASKHPGVLNINHPGYHKAREFYSPSYETKSDVQQDIRTTLYWDPDLRFENKEIPFSFYTGDLTGEFMVQVEGITFDGKPFVGRKSFITIPDIDN